MVSANTVVVDLSKEIGRQTVLVEVKGVKTIKTRLWIATKVALPFASFLMSFVMRLSGIKCEIQTTFDPYG